VESLGQDQFLGGRATQESAHGEVALEALPAPALDLGSRYYHH